MNMDSIYWMLPAGILLTPLVAFTVILLLGRFMDRYCDKLAIMAMFASFSMSVALFAVISTEQGAFAQAHPIINSISWMNLFGVDLQMGFLVDNLSAFMSTVVTGLATLVLVYSIFYMHGDSMYRRYFGFMCFFCFAMLGIVFSSNLLMTYVFWELVGLGSYFLIGFWYHKPTVAKDHHYQELKASYATGIDERLLSPAHAQKKAFVMNRIGDFGFAIGIGIFITVILAGAQTAEYAGLKLNSGPLNFDNMYAAVNDGIFTNHVSILGLSGTTLLTLAGILVFMGAMGKSAQFPLHTWLPDAMQGPTTGSSIIHAATMVAAGVYLVARIHPLLTPGALFFVAIIGGITAFLAATMALVQWDIKAVLAYSTISQLGYMMVGLGAGAYTAGVAHLFTHAIFKCMLFLCAGSVIHACHHLQDMNRLGGLRKKMPLTHLATLFGTLAITGVPFFSGFFSKDAILAGSLAAALDHGGKYWIPTVLAFATAGLTAFYMFRLLFMTFYGKPRDAHVYEGAHESPALATIPLMVLAVFCFGFWWSGHIIAHTGPLPSLTMQTAAVEPVVSGEHAHAEASDEHSEHAEHAAHTSTRVKTEIKTQGWLETLMISPLHQEEVEELAHSEKAFEHHEHLHHTAHLWATIVSILMLLLGAGIAYLMYIKAAISPETLLQIAPLRMLYNLFSQLWFVDRLYQDGIVPLWKHLNNALYAFDKNVLDGLFVDGWAVILQSWAMISRAIDDWFVDKVVDAFGWTTWIIGAFSRCLQVGKIQFYVCVTFGAVALALLGLLLSV